MEASGYPAYFLLGVLIVGLLLIWSMGLGVSLVNSPILDPRPAAKIIACIKC